MPHHIKNAKGVVVNASWFVSVARGVAQIIPESGFQ